MPIFPINPTDQQEATLGGRIFRYDAASGRWEVFRAPSTGSTAISQVDLVAAVENAGGGTEAVADVNSLPESPESGDMAFVSSTNKLYVYNGSAWFNIAIANQAPTAITGNEVSYDLAKDGTPTVVTLVSTDPEGLPLTWSATTSGDTQVGTVTNVDNVFTITPSTDEADIGTLSVTFSVTDGNNTETSISSFTLSFIPEWAEQVKLESSNLQAGDKFGAAVAISGDTIVVSALQEDIGVGEIGAAYIFTRSGSTWTEQAKIQASDKASGGELGKSVAIDGDTVVVGSQFMPGDNNLGAVYVFTRSGSTWTEQAKLMASDGSPIDIFGTDASISGDTVIIGASLQDSLGTNAGAAYIFTRSGSTWTQQAKLLASDGQANDQFGGSVSISGDTVIIGASGEDTGGSSAGAAYIFTRSGSTWTQQAKIQAGDPEASDLFGLDVSIDGDTAIVGSLYEDTNATDAGAAYIFTRSGSTWTQQAKIQASDLQSNDAFGASVSIDGDTAIVSATTVDRSGSLYVFTRDGVTWTEQVKIQGSDTIAGDEFGRLHNHTAIDNNTVVVGAQEKNSVAGAAYVFVYK